MISLFLAATIMIRGVVQDPFGAPISEAQIKLDAAHTVVTADDGHFSINPGSVWPDDLVISAAGFGARVISLPRVHASSTLDTIVLRPAATLRIHVTRGRERRALEISVGISRDDDKPRWIIHQRIAAGTDRAVIRGLSEGFYLVLIQGPETMQVATVKAGIGYGETRDVPIDLPTERRLRLRLTSGGRPVRNSRVRFSSVDTHWTGAITTNAAGMIDTPIWDGGRFQLFVRRTEGAVAVMRNVTLAGNRRMTIDLPARLVRGRVVDDHDVAVADATVTLRTTAQGGAVTAHGKTDQHGAFAFEGLEPGTAHISAIAPGYLQGASVSVPGDQLQLTLSRGYQRRIIVIAADQSPVASADVICTIGEQVKSRALTDDQGRVILAVPNNERSTLYVIPREGSLAILPLNVPSEDRDPGTLVVSVPEANASLTIAARTREDKPLPEIFFVMRVNGETIPEAVAEELDRRQGLELRTGVDGQARLNYIGAGRYEFWPYRTSSERADVIESLGIAAAPIDVVVAPGGNRATVRFQ